MTDSKTCQWTSLIAAFLVGAACTYAATRMLVTAPSPEQDSSATTTNSTTTNSSLAKARDEARAKPLVHLLDGTTLDYFYDDGSGVHMELYGGMLKYEWIRGTRKGNGNKDLKYTSREIGEDVFLISWLEASHPDYTSLIFDFKAKRMFSTGIFRFGTASQFTRFDEGLIKNPSLVKSGSK